MCYKNIFCEKSNKDFFHNSNAWLIWASIMIIFFAQL